MTDAPPPGEAGPEAGEAAAEAPPACANCGAPVPERWCSRCGQDRGRTPHVPLSELLGEAASELFALDGRMARTVVPFFFRPGFLTAEYLAGRRVRYSSPLRLYLLATLAFFLVAAQTGLVGSSGPGPGQTLVIGVTPDEPAAEASGGSGPGGASGPAGPTGPGGGGPSTVPLVGGDPARGLSPEEQVALEAEVRRLREKGDLFNRFLAGRIETLRGLSHDEANRRVGQGLLEQAPRVLFFLVPVMAGLLALLFRRRRLFFAEHFVFALHAHALGFALLTLGDLLGPSGLLAAAALSGVHLLLAVRRVYGAPWPATVARFLALALVYLLALGLGIGVATMLALAFV